MAATVPVLLHLIMRGKPKRIEFPALMFVKRHLQTQQRQYRLKHLILLMLRIAVLVFFGFALARPVLKFADWLPGPLTARNVSADRSGGFVGSLAASLGSRDAPVAAALVIDSSLRMEYVAENRSRFDAAKEFAQWILTQIPENSEIAVLSSESESAVFQVDRLAAGERIERLRITPLARSIADTAIDALALLNESQNEQRELYILTDLSQPAWPGDREKPIRQFVDEMKSNTSLFGGSAKELGVFVIDVGSEESVNSVISKISLSPETIAAGAPIQLDLELSHTGTATSKTVELLLLGQNPENPTEETLRTSKTADFSDGTSKRRLSFSLSGLAPGLHQGRVRFTVPDALSADDEAWFTISTEPPWKILLLARPPVREASLYLRHALETVPFDVETLPLTELSRMTAKELQQFQAVMLLDPSAMTPSLWKRLADYASEGGGVGVFLGPGATSTESFSDPTALEILGAKPIRQARRPDGDLWIVPNDRNSPIFLPFRQFSEFGELGSFPWEAQQVFRYWELTDLSEQVEVAASFTDGRPAILVRMLGRGHVVTVATPASETAETVQPWNYLTHNEASWMFVLLAEGIAKYMIGLGDRRFNFEMGEQIVVRPNVAQFPATCLLGTPSGESVRLTPDTVRREIVVPAAAEPGNYRIRSGGSQESLDTGFSVNRLADATFLQRIDRTRLDSFFGENNYRLAKTPREVEIWIARRRVGQELYAAILLVLAFLFAGEYVFSNRFYGKTPSGPR